METVITKLTKIQRMKTVYKWADYQITIFSLRAFANSGHEKRVTYGEREIIKTFIGYMGLRWQNSVREALNTQILIS